MVLVRFTVWNIVETYPDELDGSVVSFLNRYVNGGATGFSVVVAGDELDDLLGGIDHVEDGPHDDTDYSEDGRHASYTVRTSYIFDDIFGAKLDPYTLQEQGYGDAAETYIANHYNGYFDGGAPGYGQTLWWQTSVGQSRPGTGSNSSISPEVDEWVHYIKNATGKCFIWS